MDEMKTLPSSEEIEMLKCLVLTSLISAENEEYPEDIKQEIITRHESKRGDKSSIDNTLDWDYIFEPLGEDAYKYVKLMKA